MYLFAARYVHMYLFAVAVGLAPARFSLVWAPSRPIAPTTEHRAHHHAVDSLIIGFVKSGVVCGDACVPALACGLARESVGGFGFEVGS